MTRADANKYKLDERTHLETALDHTWQTKQPALNLETCLQYWLVKHHHVGAAPVQFVRRGTSLTFSLGSDHFIKCYAPEKTYCLQRECYGLNHLRLPVDIPQMVAKGKMGNWSYLILQRLSGDLLGQVWNQLPLPDKKRIARQLGELMQALHQCSFIPWPALHVQPDELASRHERLKVAYLERFSQGLQQRHLPFNWLDICLAGIQEGLALLVPEPPVLLHRDMGHNHLLLNKQKGEWQLTGLLDFNGLVQGPALTEFAVPILGLYQEPQVLPHLLRGYGLHPSDFNLDLAKKVTPLLLLRNRFDPLWLIQLIETKQPRSWDEVVWHLCYFFHGKLS